MSLITSISSSAVATSLRQSWIRLGDAHHLTFAGITLVSSGSMARRLQSDWAKMLLGACSPSRTRPTSCWRSSTRRRTRSSSRISKARYVLVNQAAARFVGRTPEEVVGRHDFELYPEETATTIRAGRQGRARERQADVVRGRGHELLRHAGLPGHEGRLSRQGRQDPRHLRHLARHHRAARGAGLARADAAGAVPIAEDGSGRPADRRHRARLQQHPDGDPRQPRAAADAAAATSTMRRRS